MSPIFPLSQSSVIYAMVPLLPQSLQFGSLLSPHLVQKFDRDKSVPYTDLTRNDTLTWSLLHSPSLINFRPGKTHFTLAPCSVLLLLFSVDLPICSKLQLETYKCISLLLLPLTMHSWICACVSNMVSSTNYQFSPQSIIWKPKLI